MAVDFLAAVLAGNEPKAQSYLAAPARRTVAELRQAGKLDERPTGWTVQGCSFVGDSGRFEAQVRYPNRQTAVRVLLTQIDQAWRVTGIEPISTS
jgi:hypothetical protein